MSYQLTPRRLAAARANLEKAWAAHRAGKVPRPARPTALKHGFYAQDLRKSVILVGEDVREYDEHLCRLERVFAPQNETERKIVRRLGEAIWRLLRTYRTRGTIQARRFRRLLDSVSSPLNEQQTRELAMNLVELFLDEGYIRQCITRLRNQVERLLRMFLIWRTGGDQGFRIFSHNRLEEWKKVYSG